MPLALFLRGELLKLIFKKEEYMRGVDGNWNIDSVEVNTEPASQDNGFDRLIVERDRIAIEPAGIEFSINQATSKSAILESRSQVFFAEFSQSDDQLTLNLSRPAFRETVRLNATMINVQSAS